MNRGSNTKKHILVIILSCLVALIIGLVIWIVIAKLNSKPEPINDLPNDQLFSKMREELRALDIDESIDYIDYRLTQYQDEEIQYELKMMKVNVYLNYDKPEEALAAATEISEENLTPQQKMRLYHVFYQSYAKIKNEEKAAEYLEKYQTMYNIIFGESKTE